MRQRLGLAALFAVLLFALGLVASGTASTSYVLMVSTSADRSSATPLDGVEVAGNIYVFTHDTSTGVKQVRFWLDDPAMSGSPRKSESGWPHDFNGTAGNKTAIAFDTTTIADGSHTITAAVTRTDGTSEVVSSTFTAKNGVAPPPPPPEPPPSTFSLDLSLSRDRSNPVTLEGASVSGGIYVFTGGTSTGVKQVRFWLDDPAMSGSPRKSETGWPHDFNGTAGDKTAISFDTTTIFDGAHSITAAITRTDGSTAVVTSSFTVVNSGPAPEPDKPGPPDQVHLSWTGDPATSLTVVWRTKSPSAPSIVEYRKAGAAAWSSETGAPRPSGTTGTLHEATLTGLDPATAYEYRVIGDNSSFWSDVFTTRTAPAGSETFDAVYLADTGIAGRIDGLTTGTRQVVEEIAKLNPTLVLPGGDYAYFDTDRRFSTLDSAIDAWFNQMQPIAARSPLMPTYGNHEVKGVENYGSWAARFATPAGFAERRYYSYDVGDAHFISVYAVDDDGAALPSNALAWLEQDIVAAKAAGKRWIIPYFHVSPFADGQNHPSNHTLRRQLGPLFESHGIKLAISSHDQAYERTYPLTNIGGTDTPTSSSFTCYGPDDGVVFAKVSPAGKLSNKNNNFSQFATNPAPHWTAVRNNDIHTFARLVVGGDSLRFETYGVVGDGSPPVVIDSFELNPDGCPPALTVDPPSLAFSVGPDATATATVSLATTDGAPAQANLTDDAPWLQVSPTSKTTPGSIDVTVDSTSLAAGVHSATVTAASPGHESVELPVTLTVVDTTYRLLFSASPNRLSPVRLDAQTVSGDIYVFTSPDTDVGRVRFWIDNPAMSGTPYRTESSGPFDLAGGSSTLANPFRTTSMSNGQHSVTAALDLLSGGTKVVSATFAVAN
jgi:hypothetical protein